MKTATVPAFATFVGRCCACIVILVAAFGFAGCRKPSHNPLLMLVGSDVSGSETPDRRRAYLRCVNAEAGGTVPHGTEFAIWGFGPPGALDVIMDRVATDPEDFAPMERWLVRQPVERKGTDIVPLLQRFAQQAAAEGDRPVAITLLTDGGFDDFAATKKAATALAALRNVKAVWIVPVDPGTGIRAEVCDAFSAFGGRCVVSGPFDQEDGLRRFRGLIRH